jgi:CD109 antigen
MLNISIKTNPNSFVGLLGVDQSVLLMKTGNDIDRTSVFDERDQFNNPDHYNNEFWESGDNFNDFQTSSLRIISNAKPQYNRYGKFI